MPLPPAIRLRVTLVLVAAVLGISSSAVLIRAMDAGPAAIAAWRCLMAAGFLAPFLPAARRISPRDLRLIAGSGVFLGLHFGTWFASLDYTTVLRSTVFVAMVPVWTALFEWFLFGRRPAIGFALGVAGALAGVGLLASGEGVAGWRGDLLALVASVLWSVYLLVGQDVRQRVPVLTYMGLVSLVASLTMWPVAFAMGEAVWGFSTNTWLLLVVATLGPQLMGHQGFSYAVKYVPASTIAAIMLLEPVGSTILAALVLDEWPPVTAVLGGLVVMAGVGLALR
ncbi:MAG: DMT family transporter, partial [Myxococcales bacterium]|nr:DMT family transporter [Myxococcales bacterium]